MRNSLVFLILIVISTGSNYKLFAQKVPRVVASIGAGNSDSILADDFTAQFGVRAFVWVNDIHAEPIRIDSFSLLVMRDTSIIFFQKSLTPYFDENEKKFFKQLKTGDKILVYDIYTTLYKYKALKEQRRLVAPLEYLIK